MADWFDVLAGEGRAVLANALAAADRRMAEAERRRGEAERAVGSLAAWEARLAELARAQAALAAEIATLETRMVAAQAALVARCTALASALEANAAAGAAAGLLADVQPLIASDLDQMTPAQLKRALDTLDIAGTRRRLRRRCAKALADLDQAAQYLDRRARLDADLAALDAQCAQLAAALVSHHAVDQAVLDGIDGLEHDHLVQFADELAVLLADARIEAGWNLPADVLQELRS